ncbi:hypothetical protein D3C78_1159610 [compost metagenome]
MAHGEAGLVAAQVEHGVCDFLRAAHAASRVVDGLVHGAVDHAQAHVGLDQARADRVDADAFLGEFNGRRLGQADHRVLGGGVDAHVLHAADTGHRGGVDDSAAALGRHQRQLVLQALPHALDVDVHDRVELAFVEGRKAVLLAFDAGVVHGVVEATIGGDGLLDHGLGVGFAGHVATDEGRFATGVADQLHGAFAAFGVEVGDDHLQAFGGERQCHCTTDTASGASDQGDLAGEFHCHCCSVLRKGSGACSGSSRPR